MMTDRRAWIRPSFLYVLIFALLVALAFVSYAHFSHPVTTVLVVRHAEKEAGPAGGDPALSAAGHERAQALVHVVGNAGIKAIYSTQFTRTQQTVQPLADHLKLSVNKIEAAKVDELVDRVLSDHAGEAVLVSGHSNTVPQIIEKLGGGMIPAIDEKNEYDNLYVVVVYRFGKAQVERLKYGTPNRPEAR